MHKYNALYDVRSYCRASIDDFYVSAALSYWTSAESNGDGATAVLEMRGEDRTFLFMTDSKATTTIQTRFREPNGWSGAVSILPQR